MDQRPQPAVLARLRAHYAADVALLERLVGPVPGVTDLPWLSDARSATAPAPRP
jgi:hypothetical protein